MKHSKPVHDSLVCLLLQGQFMIIMQPCITINDLICFLVSMVVNPGFDPHVFLSQFLKNFLSYTIILHTWLTQSELVKCVCFITTIKQPWARYGEFERSCWCHEIARFSCTTTVVCSGSFSGWVSMQELNGITMTSGHDSDMRNRPMRWK